MKAENTGPLVRIWETGDCDPSDWDGGPVLCGDMKWRPVPQHRFDGKSRNCIIAYRPLNDTPPGCALCAHPRTYALLIALDSYYGIISDLEGNGCEHGFKPAVSCPNHACEKRQIHALWEKVINHVD